VKTLQDARRLRDAGADAVLIGEAAMRDPALISQISALS
jgi:tRNA-dihydrouridine synthase